MQNFSEAEFRAPIRDEGKVCTATGNGMIPFVSTEDIARVAKHLLTDDKPHNTEYVVLGPELLSYDDVRYTPIHPHLEEVYTFTSAYKCIKSCGEVVKCTLTFRLLCCGHTIS